MHEGNVQLTGVHHRQGPATPVDGLTPDTGASAPRFGTVPLSDGHLRFYDRLNHQILDLCASLPRSMRTDGLLFFTQYAGLSIGSGVDFFHHFIVPSWSIVYHLCQSDAGGLKADSGLGAAAISAHAMAMCLHSLDDHIADGQLVVTPLTMLIRSQAWLKMHASLDLLTAAVPEGASVVAKCIDRYYASLAPANHPDNLEDYCTRFRDQMATGFIVPLLLSKLRTATPSFASTVEKAFGDFGIAWRLLDDIRDLAADMSASSPTAVYVCLDEIRKRLWLEESSHENEITTYIRQNNVCRLLVERMRYQLDDAAKLMTAIGIPAMAEEYRSLLKPLISNSQA